MLAAIRNSVKQKMKQERAADGFGSCRPPPTPKERRRSGLPIIIQNSPRRIPAYISAAKASQPRKQTKPKLGGAEKKHDSARGRRRPCPVRQGLDARCLHKRKMVGRCAANASPRIISSLGFRSSKRRTPGARDRARIRGMEGSDTHRETSGCPEAFRCPEAASANLKRPQESSCTRRLINAEHEDGQQ